MGFGLTYKHCCVIHRVQDSPNSFITDNAYQSHIKKVLNDSIEKSENNSKFWNDPYNVYKHNQYCRYCRIHDVKDDQSKEYM